MTTILGDSLISGCSASGGNSPIVVTSVRRGAVAQKFKCQRFQKIYASLFRVCGQELCVCVCVHEHFFFFGLRRNSQIQTSEQRDAALLGAVWKKQKSFLVTLVCLMFRAKGGGGEKMVT